MQTILGANGQIGTELAHALHDSHDAELRLVSRHPRAVDPTDELVSADPLDPAAARRAVEGSDIAYLTLGLPPDARLWAAQFPVVMRNVIDACAASGTKLVFFDNTYMYPKTSAPQTESTPFEPVGSKAVTRARIATMLLDAIADGRVEGVICRAPEFYGPGRTQSFTNALVFDRIARGEDARIPISDRTRRTLIWTPDASRAMALVGNTPDAFGRTWHLPVDASRPTYREIVDECVDAWGREVDARVVPAWQFRLARLFSRPAREIGELLPRYAVDNIFRSDAFDAAFPDFPTTTVREGIRHLAAHTSERTTR
ncbi:NAD-dependent epimerase/dehydratase family protein [Pseudoclavibacter chungangensis]|uniref:NAD-dependent epimerase/dehydratase family protein n=1 Tax=Pseudoclavibacter chungangensis TaxID=587635 RepID=A0A7J5BZ89_9MICO|nr:NAD-dependent epimerase/dehydratase family protein [Pseudoclavibacter chungangensis]KAB1659617.1 NAD-dependent epimerase/dehydratase family protein [Pseudoclavibacter chungangensis]NYJ67445.1 nucleoside-diphosphate-sugar epimerase [Pseudoclavibacter chungangensis]